MTLISLDETDLDARWEEDLTDEQRDALYEEKMRVYRNNLLASCDWTQLPDAPLSDRQRVEWATYRQALRDYPATWTVGSGADFPDPPAS